MTKQNKGVSDLEIEVATRLIGKRWKINHLLFCETELTLKDGEQITELAPRLAEVLSYFCRHPNVIVSRDELIEHVWNGQIVTDNAVNRIIAKLRKALGDDAKSAQYILTYPRKGYRFIAPVSEEKQQEQEKENQSKPNSKYRYSIPLVLALLITVLIVLIQVSPTKNALIEGSQAITWGDSMEFDAAISPDGKYLAYSAEVGNRITLFIKDLKNSEIDQVVNSQGNAGASQWSIDGSKLLYLYTDDTACQYRILQFNSGLKSTESIVHNCPQGSYGNAKFSHDGNSIYYAERISDAAPYYLFSLDLKTSKKTKLNQPSALLAGNSEFDLHPFENKLLITSPDPQQQLAFYELDIDTDKLSFMFSKNEYICCPIWDHSGQNIVMMSEYPAKGFITFDLDGENPNVLFNTNLRVGPPTRAPDSQNYLYSGGTYDFDIAFYAFAGEHDFSFANSSTADYLPALNSSATTLAFMSQRSGEAQLWIQPFNTSNAIKVSTFSDHQRYYDLKWSPSQSHIALLLINSIKVIDVITGQTTSLKLPQQQMRNISWLDSNRLAFSAQNKNGWRVNLYQIDTHKVSLQNEQWAAVSFDPVGKNQLVIDQAGNLLLNSKKLPLVVSGSYMRRNRKMEFRLYNGRVYYQDAKNNTLLEFDNDTQSKRVLLTGQGNIDFSVSEKGILLTDNKHRTSEIYRTFQKSP